MSVVFFRGMNPEIAEVEASSPPRDLFPQAGVERRTLGLAVFMGSGLIDDARCYFLDPLPLGEL